MKDQIIIEWNEVNRVNDLPVSYPIKQVYCWMITKDNKIVLVSKDGDSWQLPGGKPNAADKSLIATAIREVIEETGLNIGSIKSDIRFFGYYKVSENGMSYLQIRSYIKLDAVSSDLCFHVLNESKSQSKEDIIKFVEAVNLSEATDRISWLPKSGEYKTLKSLNII